MLEAHLCYRIEAVKPARSKGKARFLLRESEGRRLADTAGGACHGDHRVLQAHVRSLGGP
jgi:hypothetical protein